MTSLITKRLLIVPPSASLEDIEKQVKWLNDPTIMRYSEQRHKQHTIRSQLDYIESFQPPNLFRLIISNDAMIGTITAFVDRHNKIADMGVLIGEQPGQGYGTEAWTALMNHLLNTGIRKVEAGCMELNQPMIAVFKKSGMRFEGCREHHFLCDGQPCAMEYWGRFND